ncbi:TPA: hypothetical protein ACX3DO_004474 [Vibrio parahaemolyticus]|nr:hypothetical protein [Vibrio parahaemolyticus]MBE4323062.1 hypothetical protein [Vibrio parahaemolyticus]
MKKRLRMLMREFPELEEFIEIFDSYMDERDSRLLSQIQSSKSTCKYNNSDDMGYMVETGKRTEAIREITNYTNGAQKLTVIDPYMLGKITSKCEVNEKFINLSITKEVSSNIIDILQNVNGQSFESVEKLINYVKKKCEKEKIPIAEKNINKIDKIAHELFIKDCYVSDFMKAVSHKSIKELKIIFGSSYSDSQKVRREIEKSCPARVSFIDLDKYENISIHDRIWIVDQKKAVLVGNSFGGLGMNAISFILPLPTEDLVNLTQALALNGIKI